MGVYLKDVRLDDELVASAHSLSCLREGGVYLVLQDDDGHLYVICEAREKHYPKHNINAHGVLRDFSKHIKPRS